MSIPLAKAEQIAESLCNVLSPLCTQVQVAGSIRRQCPHVNDIDLIAELTEMQRFPFRERCLRSNPAIISDGRQLLAFTLANGLKIDIVMVPAPEPGLFDTPPSSWGSCLLQRTGSREHNVWFARECIKRELRWEVFKGIYRKTDLIASETEEEMYACIEHDYIDPTARSLIHD